MIDNLVKVGERLDDLQVNGLKIIQNPNAFCFGCDAVEIANFVSGGTKDRAVDLGSGTGIITLLLAGKKNIQCTGIEIQADMADMSERSIKLNGLTNATIMNIPIQDIPKHMEKGSVSIVVSNPPYAKNNSGDKNLIEGIAIARSEIAITLQEIVNIASYLLPTGGSFYIVHRIERLAEVMHECSQKKLQPKVLQILTPNKKKPPHLFLLKAVKDGKVGLVVMPEREVDTVV